MDEYCSSIFSWSIWKTLKDFFQSSCWVAFQTQQHSQTEAGSSQQTMVWYMQSRAARHFQTSTFEKQGTATHHKRANYMSLRISSSFYNPGRGDTRLKTPCVNCSNMFYVENSTKWKISLSNAYTAVLNSHQGLF